MPQKKPSERISNRVRKIMALQDYVYKPRARHPNEALPPQNNLWLRPVYVPSRDNK